MMNNNAIELFMNDKRVTSNYHSHVSMINPMGKYQIDRKNIEEFWTLYIDYVANGFPGLGLAEKSGHYLPVLVDVDLKIIENDSYIGSCLYTSDDLNKIVTIYQHVLKEIVEGISDEDLMCVVLEKNMYRVKNGDITYLKNGFHLQFPGIFLNKADQEIHLIPRIKTAIRGLNMFEKIGYADSGAVIDNGYCTAPWLMYGCRKKETMDPYLVTKVISSNGSIVDIEQAFVNYKLYNAREEKINIRGNVVKYLPRILSIISYGRPSNEIKEGMEIPSIATLDATLIINKERKILDKKNYPDANIDEKIKTTKTLISMLSQTRAEDRNEWLTIGWILYNIFDGGDDGLEIWNDFSSSCSNYNEVVNASEWNKMTRRNFTVGTLKFYAGIDSPEEYNEYKKKNTALFANKAAMAGSHNDIAKIMQSEFGNEFICASVTSKIWYQFIGHKWEEIEDGVFLRKKISNEIVSKFEEIVNDYKAQNIVAESRYDANELKIIKKNSNDKLSEHLFKVIANLKTSPFKTNVMKECAEIFYDKTFKYKLDTNPLTIAFKNGVYDLTTNILRIGVPEDYISNSMPIDYIEYTQLSKEVLAVHSFLEKLFPDVSVREYFMDTSSDVFIGENKQKIVLFWTGEGDNGKSVTQRLFELMLGPLAIKFSTTLITGKKTGTGTANPELARAGGGVRWAVLEEPDGDEAINIGILKSLSGNDSYWARDLFQSGKSAREITPMFKLIFICNKLPSLKHSDKAVWNRIRVIPFESTFIRAGDPCPETEEEQLREKKFPMDNDLYSKIPSMVQAFAWILLNHRKNNLNKIRTEPLKVLMATQQYRNQNDVYRQYIDECLVATENKKISVSDIYNDIKAWLRDGFPGHAPPSRTDVITYFDKAIGKQEYGHWVGYIHRKDLSNKQDNNTSPI